MIQTVISRRLVCDGPDCRNWITSSSRRQTPRELRVTASGLGWTYDYENHYCPGCSAKTKEKIAA